MQEIYEQILQTQKEILGKMNKLEEKIGIIENKLDRIDIKFTNIANEVMTVQNDVNILKNEAKLIAAWQDAKKRNNMSGPETWYELTKSLHQYFAEQVNQHNQSIN